MLAPGAAESLPGYLKVEMGRKETRTSGGHMSEMTTLGDLFMDHGYHTQSLIPWEPHTVKSLQG